MEDELYIDSVEFYYDSRRPLLTGVYMSCKVGEIVGLLGRNGSGKSTLLKIIFGTLSPKMAFIKIKGKPVKSTFKTREVLYLPQENYLPNDAKVYQVIGLMIHDLNDKTAVMKDIRIQKIMDQKIYSLSGGEKRYLEILLLIYQKGSFVLLDEPFSGIEPMYVEYVQQLILDNKYKKGFIISDHNYQNVLDITTRITLLKDGGCMRIADKKDLELFYVPEGTFTQSDE